MKTHLPIPKTSLLKIASFCVLFTCCAMGEVFAENAEDNSEDKPDAKIQIFLLDGSIIVGEILEQDIKITTPYGALTVPTSKVVGFRPGLNSQKELGAKIMGHIKQLGDDDSENRELAHKAILRLGLPIQPILKEALKGADLDLSNRIKSLLKLFSEAEEELSEEEVDAPPEPLRKEDILKVPSFNIHGKIEIEAFTVKSRFGTIKVNLSDILEAKRIKVVTESLKTISVEGKFIAQNNFKSSGLQVELGDKVHVSASGKITMTPWGRNQTSGPDGGANFNWYVDSKIPGGCLVAQIGASGDIFKVGSKKTFTAKKNGTLRFAIGIPSNYLNYQYPGTYRVKIKVTPANMP